MWGGCWLIESNNWMLQTIGWIAIRDDMSKDIIVLIEDIIIDSKAIMDLVWLADLYYTDSKFRNIKISLKSNLAKTKWGVLEIWKR